MFLLKSLKLTENLRHLLTITEQLILEKGCINTTLQDIIKRSGLSKGAIYHYVRSKDELFGLILQIKMEKTNADFHKETQKANAGLEGPLTAIVNRLKLLLDETDVTNTIFIYLLGRKSDPAIADILSHIYQYSSELSISWIKAGQKAGVIAGDLDPKQVTTMFITFSYGLRVQAMIDPTTISHSLQEFHELMRNTLGTTSA